MNGYWDATDRYLNGHGGRGPKCPACGDEMFAADDHGRFMCLCQGLGSRFDTVSQQMLPPPPPIPQVDTKGMSDEEKSKIPPINRLYDEPTEAEKKIFQELRQRHLKDQDSR